MRNLHLNWAAAVLKLSLFISVVSTCASGQTLVLSDLDKRIKEGLELVPNKEWSKAKVLFESALMIVEKNSEPSPFLIRKLSLPDEDPDYIPRSKEEAAISGYRHVMGTKQALLEFLAFTSQLEGNKEKAEEYFEGVYRMQGPLWGSSWRTFIPQIQAVFHLSAPVERKARIMAGTCFYRASCYGIRVSKQARKSYWNLRRFCQRIRTSPLCLPPCS